MKRAGTSIIFINKHHEILLFLRDDIPDLPYRNTWDLPGGHMEEGETPEECIVREIKEEINLDLDNFRLFRVYEFEDRTEYTFWKKAAIDVKTTPLSEGQCLKWFSGDEVKRMELAYGFNRVTDDFFREMPFPDESHLGE